MEHEKQMKRPEIVACAAIKFTMRGTIVILAGRRHSDCLRQSYPSLTPFVKQRSTVQGFMKTRGRFVTREQGRKLQERAGIPSADSEGYRGTTLLSEDLY